MADATERRPEPRPYVGDDGAPWCAGVCRHRSYDARGAKCRLTGDAVSALHLCRPAVAAMHAELTQLRVHKAATNAHNWPVTCGCARCRRERGRD